MWFRRARISKVTNPKFDTTSGQSTVSMVFELLGEGGVAQGRLNLTIKFDYLLEHIKALAWWKSDAVFLVDETGRILAQGTGIKEKRKRLGEGNDPLEIETLRAISRKNSGTLLGPGHPAESVSVSIT